MRGDEGVLMDFRPTGVAWLDNGKLLVVDQRYNAFHLFDTDGRRFRFIEFPRIISPTFYSGLCRLEDNVFFATGSHYHEKNDRRYLRGRSEMHKIVLEGESLGPDSVVDNYSPDRALRATRLYGQTPVQQMEITGIAMDAKHNRLFLGLSQPVSEKGTVLLFVGPLDKFLARDESIELEPLETNLIPPVEPACNVPTYLSDIAYVPGKGVVLLMTAEADGGFRFCSNQIWFMKGGFGPAKLVAQELAPGNRAAGIALRESGDWEYDVALVCDNNPDESKIPSRLVLLKGVHLKLR